MSSNTNRTEKSAKSKPGVSNFDFFFTGGCFPFVFNKVCDKNTKLKSFFLINQ